jgi:xanthine dehydrogenase accessory factor
MLRESNSGLLTFKLDHDYGWDDGLICGGTIELAVGALPDADELEDIISDIEKRKATSLSVMIESPGGAQRYVLDLPPADRLYIAGAGHVGQALAAMASELDFQVTVFDDRDDLLRDLPKAGLRTVGGDIAASLRSAQFDDSTYCAILTRGHRHDEEALHAVIDKPAAYIGMIGSRRKVKLIFDDLRVLGVDEALFARIHAPIGLDINAVSVREIAVSIAAQLVKVRRTNGGSPVRGPQVVREAAVALT